MKRQGKKIAAWGMALSMLFSSLGGIQVFSAEPTATAYETFDSFTANTDYEGSNDTISGITFRTTGSNIAENLFRFENVKGYGGKTAEDGALMLSYNPNIAIGSDKPETGAQATVTFADAPKATNDGDYYEISFDYAFEGHGEFEIKESTNQYKVLGIRNGKFYNMFQNRSGNWQTPTVAEYDVALQPSTWYRMRVVMQKAEDSMNVRVYINDVLAYSGQTNHAMKNFGGINILQGADGSTVKVGQTTASEGLPTAYVDNFRVSTYTEDPMADVVQKMSMGFDNMTVSDDKEAIISDFSKHMDQFGIGGQQNAIGSEMAAMKIAGGVMGKASDDKSVYLNKAGKTYGDQSHMLLLNTYGMSDKLANQNGPSAAKGEYTNVEVYMAYDGQDAQTVIQGHYKGMNQDGKGSVSTLIINQDGSVAALNTKAEGVRLVPNCWYKFNLVIYSGDNTAETDAEKNWFKLYINDELAIDQTVFIPTGRNNTTLDTFVGFQKFWLQSMSLYKSVDAPDRAQSGSYFDDFSMTYQKTEPTFTAPSLTYSTEYAEMAMGGGLYGYVSSQMKDATLSAEGATVTIIDQKGTEKAAFTGSGSNYIRVIKADQTKLYGVADQVRIVDKEMHDFPSDSKLDMNVGTKAFTTIEPDSDENGLAGKKREDTYFTFNTVDAYQDGNDNLNPFITLSIGGKGNQLQKLNPAQTYTIETTLRATGAYGAATLQFRSNVPTGQSGHYDQNVFSITGDGKIVDRNWTTVGAYHQGEWVKVAITVYPKANMLYTYVNGRLVYQGALWKDGYQNATLSRFKIENSFPQSDEEHKNSGVLNVDDLAFYNGTYNPAPITLTSSLADIYNNGCVLFANENSYAELIEDGLTGVDANTVLYRDANMTQTAMDFSEGSILAVPNASGDMVKYYYVSTGAPTALKVNKLLSADGQAADYSEGAHAYKAQLAAFVPLDAKNVTLVMAEKAQGTLKSVAMNESEMTAEVFGGDAYAYPVMVESGTLNMEIKDASSALTVYTLDGMTPMTSVLSIAK